MNSRVNKQVEALNCSVKEQVEPNKMLFLRHTLSHDHFRSHVETLVKNDTNLFRILSDVTLSSRYQLK